MTRYRLLLFFVLTLGVALLFSLPASAMPPQQEGEENRAPGYYQVEEGDTLLSIAIRFDLELDTLLDVNEIEDSARIRVGQQLIIPGSDGSLPEPLAEAPQEATSSPVTDGTASEETAATTTGLVDIFASATRGSVTERMTRQARRTAPNSPLYKKTWLTYYGRPNVEQMGILGEYSIEELIPRLRAQAEAYDEANGPDIGVMPAFHLVHGMALSGRNEDGSYLAYLSDEAILSYIEAAEREGFAVILDIQIGALTPLEAMERAFKWLEYPNVHLALDPEFAMREPGQERPGRPPGWVTAEEVNQVQHAMRDYMKEHGIAGRRILILHQFLLTMIVDKEQLEKVYKVDLVVTADGFGNVWQKVGKYNQFIHDEIEYSGFKLFYRWDDPLMTEREVLGIDLHPERAFIDYTPNLVIYQ